MPLSEHEQRILDEIERRLAAEDPKFARSTALATPRGVAIKRIKRAAAGFLFGLALLLSSLVATLSNAALFWPLSLLSFAVMLLSVVAFARASKHVGKMQRPARGENWFSRAEDRWKKRFERGDGRP
ncbi:MAG TPA: DUF3040 domain-containing protein [Actinomycetota bacterium]|nr:DUF3040 domain-containing protein [Actinomycetota bacterium]